MRSVPLRMGIAYLIPKMIGSKMETIRRLSPLFVQLMHINCYKIVKRLKSFKITIVAPTCFGLHKPSSGSSAPMLR